MCANSAQTHHNCLQSTVYLYIVIEEKSYCFKANFLQEAMFFILCHRFFLHSPLFKSCCHTTFEYLSHCWGWASLLERAATAVASQQLTELKFKLGREALSTQQSCKKNWWQTNFKHLFYDLFGFSGELKSFLKGHFYLSSNKSTQFIFYFQQNLSHFMWGSFLTVGKC